MYALFLILVAALLLLLLLEPSSTKKQQHKVSDGLLEKIPRKVWTFWDSDELPVFIQKCISTWKFEGRDVEIITPSTIKNYLSDEELSWKHFDNAAKISDLVRLSVLHKHGGVWLDASIVCYESLDWVFESSEQCILYKRPLDIIDTVVPESWFIACTSGNEFVKAWYDEFMRVGIEYRSIEEYTNEARMGLLDGIEDAKYLLAYVCGKKVLEQGGYDVKIIDASTGPRKFMYDVSDMCDQDVKKPEFVKLTHQDREQIFENPKLEACVFSGTTYQSQDEPLSCSHRRG